MITASSWLNGPGFLGLRRLAREVADEIFVKMAKEGSTVSGLMGLIGLVPGMPHLVFLLIASGLGYLAWQMAQRQRREANAPPPASAAEFLAADRGGRPLLVLQHRAGDAHGIEHRHAVA